MSEPSLTGSSVDLALQIWESLEIDESQLVNPMGWFLLGFGLPPQIAMQLSEGFNEDRDTGKE